ncbi:MAG: peptidase M50 family [archaeon GW2011_AR5]|nr:MAG: peptidase M50 family [archaeon GW2011_AR5]
MEPDKLFLSHAVTDGAPPLLFKKSLLSMKFTFTAIEVKEIVISAVVLSFAFALAYSDGIFSLNLAVLPVLVLFAFIAVGIGFLAHELIGHKLIAQRLGLHAEYRMWKFGLVIALLSSLAGFVFAAPGAVYVSSRVDLWGRQSGVSKKRMGIVSLSGPLINLLLVAAFLPLQLIYPITVLGVELFSLAVFVNLWLAIFNMLPIPPLDGSKVLSWNKVIWASFFALLVLIFLALQPVFF